MQSLEKINIGIIALEYARLPLGVEFGRGCLQLTYLVDKSYSQSMKAGRYKAKSIRVAEAASTF